MFKDWAFADYPNKNGLKVFGAFVCGGGSTMGFKLAGYEHLGGIEIDPKIANIYRMNHNPKYLYNEDIREFNKRVDIPNELFNIDVFEASPPCTSFSTAGNRETKWGVEKKFAEGGKLQTLDDLFFVTIETVSILKPKVVILENVSGMLKGNAKVYTKKVVESLSIIGYDTQVFLLNSATMGVPQKRERVFFVAKRKDLNLPILKLNFDEKPIYFAEIESKENNENTLTEEAFNLWVKRKPSDKTLSCVNQRVNNTINRFNICFICRDSTPNSILATSNHLVYDKPRYLDNEELRKISSFPKDYNFNNKSPLFLVGMSVPPKMMYGVANEVKKQLFRLS